MSLALTDQVVGAGFDVVGVGRRAAAASNAVTQTRPTEEIVVLDDGSTHDPAAVVAQIQSVKVLRQDNRGLAGASNTLPHENKIVFIASLLFRRERI
jgi:hypothetical protein